MAPIQAYDCSVFGLHIRSELPLPELLPAPPGARPDVTIRLGEVAAVGGLDSAVRATAQGLVLTIDGIARYAVADGSRITIDRAPGVPDANVRLYLLGSAMGVLLHQRGLLPLHANAVEIGGKAVAFMGASGAGKSTLAAWFHDRGHRVIADDVCVMQFDGDGIPMASPGLPRLRLWREAMEATGRDASRYTRSYAGDESFQKYDVPIRAQGAVRAATRLGCIYVLARGNKLSFRRLRGLQKSEAIFAHTYRGAYLSSTGTVPLHWHACAELVRRTPIFEVVRTQDFSEFGQEVDQIVTHATAIMDEHSSSD